MLVGKSIRIYLADSNVTGIRYAELVNWTGHAIACPRNRLSELKNWPESSKPGVYFLFEGRFGNATPMAYIGESENVRERVTSQDRDKDFWSEVVIFTSKDENLTKAHSKYLESAMVNLSIKADRYILENGNLPTESSLPRADRDAMKEFIDNARMVLGTLGYTILEPVLETTNNLDSFHNPNDELRNLSFKVNAIVAQGAITDEGFVLKKGSQLAKLDSSSMPIKLSENKRKLLEDGTLKDQGKHLILTTDVLFNSSSYAASMVAGTSRSGPQSWKSLEGKTIRQIEDDELR